METHVPVLKMFSRTMWKPNQTVTRSGSKAHLIPRPIRPSLNLPERRLRRGAPACPGPDRNTKSQNLRLQQHEAQDGRVRLCKNYKTHLWSGYFSSLPAPPGRASRSDLPGSCGSATLGWWGGVSLGGFAVLQFALPPFGRAGEGGLSSEWRGGGGCWMSGAEVFGRFPCSVTCGRGGFGGGVVMLSVCLFARLGGGDKQ